MNGEPSWDERYREYLLLAQEARRAAYGADDLQARRSFEMIADGWQHLAENVARMFLQH